MHGIPPGEYRVLVWEDVDPDAWLDSEFTDIYQNYSQPLATRRAYDLSRPAQCPIASLSETRSTRLRIAHI